MFRRHGSCLVTLGGSPLPKIEGTTVGAFRGVPKRKFKTSQEQVVLCLTAVLLVLLAVFLPGFFSIKNMLVLLNNISILGILGLGMGLIIISRGIDLSEIAIMAGAWAIGLSAIESGASVPVAIALSLASALAIGILNGLMVAFVEAPALFVTLATGFVVYGVVFWVSPTLVHNTPQDETALVFLGTGLLFGVPMPIIVFATCAIAVHLFLSRTSLGRFVYAQGDNPETARLTGIPVRPMIVLQYALVAFFAWLAGLVWIGTSGSIQMTVVQGTYIYDVILVVILGGVSLVGGRGSALSVVAGCFLIGTLLNAFTIMNINSDIQNIIRGGVLLLAIVIDNYFHPRDEETARQGD
jgi:ribose transport system permease protein